MKRFLTYLFVLGASAVVVSSANGENYQNNRYPLYAKPYMELPLGSIKAKGWLLEMLERQRSGATGCMDKLYPEVMGNRNGWLGGDGDQWERGPYWIDGLLPLAYILDDKNLQEKAQAWVEWALESQREDGFFGPAKDYPPEDGLQRDNSSDWWPRMVVLKILQQYYSATGDERVIDFLVKYFRYQLATLPSQPLGKWTFWAEYRVCDNLQVVYWLYNITGEPFLLELSEILHKQGHDFVNMFLNTDAMKQNRSIHCVNLAQGIKEPVIYYQQHPEQKYLDAVAKGLEDIRIYHGQPQGMYGGDEGLHGNSPTQGSELCSAVEFMLSLEEMLEITGNVSFAGHLERIAFNALPTQITDDFMGKQYFQQPNQVKITRHTRNFYEEGSHGGTDIVYGTLTGYPCCVSNMHQGWPKFVQNLWYATADDGIAALVYSPSEVTAKVGNGCTVRITEDTYYPMDQQIKFTVSILDKGVDGIAFPFHLRIPEWSRDAAVKINGEKVRVEVKDGIVVLNRIWKNGDIVELDFPMEVAVSRWYDGAVAVERGPLVYGLYMEELWTKRNFGKEEIKRYGESYYEVTSDTKWNYGIPVSVADNIKDAAKVEIDPVKVKNTYPWNLKNAPIRIKLKAKEIPNWTLYNETAGPIPFSVYPVNTPETEITLIPYGCTTLRISEFPLTW